MGCCHGKHRDEQSYDVESPYGTEVDPRTGRSSIIAQELDPLELDLGLEPVLEGHDVAEPIDQQHPDPPPEPVPGPESTPTLRQSDPTLRRPESPETTLPAAPESPTSGPYGPISPSELPPALRLAFRNLGGNAGGEAKADGAPITVMQPASQHGFAPEPSELSDATAGDGDSKGDDNFEDDFGGGPIPRADSYAEALVGSSFPAIVVDDSTLKVRKKTGGLNRHNNPLLRASMAVSKELRTKIGSVRPYPAPGSKAPGGLGGPAGLLTAPGPSPGLLPGVLPPGTGSRKGSTESEATLYDNSSRKQSSISMHNAVRSGSVQWVDGNIDPKMRGDSGAVASLQADQIEAMMREWESEASQEFVELAGGRDSVDLSDPASLKMATLCKAEIDELTAEWEAEADHVAASL